MTASTNAAASNDRRRTPRKDSEAAAPERRRSRSTERQEPRRRRGAEPFEDLLWRLQARRGDDAGRLQTVGLIGCDALSGTTTVAANLAVCAADAGLGPVLLVETHRGSRPLAKAWSLGRGPGLADVVAGDAALAEALRPGPAPNLNVLPVGNLRRNEVVAWEPNVLQAMLDETSAEHRLLVFDLPAANQLRQGLMLARRLDHLLLVVRAEVTRSGEALEAAQRLANDGLEPAGVVLNRSRQYVPRWMRAWL